MANKVLTQTGNQVQSDLNFVENLVPEYNSSNSYEPGNIVRYQDNLYRCIANTTGSWDLTKWTQITLSFLSLYKHTINLRYENPVGTFLYNRKLILISLSGLPVATLTDIHNAILSGNVLSKVYVDENNNNYQLFDVNSSYIAYWVIGSADAAILSYNVSTEHIEEIMGSVETI